MRFAGLVVVAAAALVAGCDGGGSVGGLDAERVFTIPLTTMEEIPRPSSSTAAGTAQIIVYPSQVEFTLAANGITGITMAHIHSGAAGNTGPIVVTLFQPSNATGSVSGIFATGTLNANTLPSSVTLESLKTLLASGNSYVNVHTTANPLGEIRGQIR